MSPEEGIVAIQEAVNQRVRRTQGLVGANFRAGANELRNAALTVLANPSPSAPGSPPGVRSGNLRTKWKVISYGSRGNGIMAIESKMKYSGYVEHGTEKMAARPYVERVKQEALPEILDLFSELGG